MPRPLPHSRALLPYLAALLLPIASSYAAEPAQTAQSNRTLCSAYGKIASSSAEFMLPLPLGQLVGMVSGKDEALLERYMAHMLDAMSGHEMVALSNLAQEDVNAISEAAGEAAIHLLMSGGALTAEEVGTVLTSHCEKVGARTIIANQNMVQQSRAAGLPQP